MEKENNRGKFSNMAGRAGELSHPETIATSPSAVSRVRKCENAWDNILEFQRPAVHGWDATAGLRAVEEQ